MNAIAADIPYSRLLPPAVLLFGDDEERRRVLADRITAAGGRVVANAPIDQALRRLDMQAVAGGVVLDLRSDGGGVLDALLARLDALGEMSGRFGSVIVTPPDLIDVVVARIEGISTTILVDPEDRDLDEAFKDLVTTPEPCVAEGPEFDGRKLARLSEEVSRIARALAALSGDEAPRGPAAVPDDAGDASLLRNLIKLRRLRGQYFQPALFADPAWDILLDLASARIEGRQVSVSSLCIAAAVPPTTALRWITQMTAQSLLVRQPDPDDGRRVFIALGDQAAMAMHGYLEAARRFLSPAA